MNVENPRIVALLPMKANSVRVKNKNFRKFAGKPLYRHILDTLLSIRDIDQIVIDTDAISQLLTSGLKKQPRILLRERKTDLCGDNVSMNKILADDIAHVDADIYLMTHNTNPLLRAETIIAALNQYKKALKHRDADSLFTVTKVQTRFYDADGQPYNHDPKNLIPTQDLPTLFEENSNLYLFTKDSFKKSGARIGTKPLLFETPLLESFDIDTPAEWTIAEAVALYQQPNV